MKKLNEFKQGDKIYYFNSKFSPEIVEVDFSYENLKDYRNIESILLNLSPEELEKSAVTNLSGNDIFNIHLIGISTSKECLKKELLREQEILFCGIKNYKLKWD